MSKFLELFENEDGRMSMTRCLCFMSFFPSTWVMIVTPPEHIETVFGIYVGAFVLQYVGGKVSEKIRIGQFQPPISVEQSGTGDINVTK